MLPGASTAVSLLQELQVPYVFLTNGGGVLEADKAAQLSTALQVPVAPEQVIVSHSPMRPLAAQHAGEKVLVLGCRDVQAVATAYGFHPVVTVNELAAHDPTAYPFFDWQHQPLPTAVAEAPFGAVLIMHDPIHWAPDLQLALDVIRGGSPLGSGASQALPVYASNPDFVFAGAHPVPRFAQGAFTDTLSFLFHRLTGQQLRVTQYGKPHAVTFDFAWDTLARQGKGAAPSRVFMIGDNPRADVRGANAAGDAWSSVLVCSGVHSPPGPVPPSIALEADPLLASVAALGTESNGKEDRADLVVPGVLDAVVGALSLWSGGVPVHSPSPTAC